MSLSLVNDVLHNLQVLMVHVLRNIIEQPLQIFVWNLLETESNTEGKYSENYCHPVLVCGNCPDLKHNEVGIVGHCKDNGKLSKYDHDVK